MARLSPETVAALNVVASSSGMIPGKVLAAWGMQWRGPCVDPTCSYRNHRFTLYEEVHELAVADMPAGKLACAVDDGEIVNIPLSKNQIVELIEDLRGLLNELP